MMKPVIFLNSHPIQYFAPLYQEMASAGIPITAWYCSDESIQGKTDKGFGTAVKWDIPLLAGYQSVFIKNRSWKPSIHKGFWGLFNPGIIRLLYRQPSSVLIIHGWAYSTNIIAILFGKIFGHVVCLRAETPMNQELKKNKTITACKHVYLRFLFLFVQQFLYIGKQNRLFYKALGVADSKLLFVPYSVDNKRFRSLNDATDKTTARQQLQLPVAKKLILYSGKYISKKRPMDLLKAFQKMENRQELLLMMVGDGACRAEMELFIQEHGLQASVLLTGFVNQSQIPLYYKSADLFVMCSGLGETWGLSVNEAMNFGLPVIISDTCGAAYDLVENNVTGSIFETGNIDQLAALITHYLQLDHKAMLDISEAAFNKIDEYSYSQVIKAIETLR